MPDHLHGILEILQSSKTTLQSGNEEPLHATAVLQIPSTDGNVKPVHATAPLQKAAKSNKDEHMSAISPKSGSLGTVIRSYKSAVSKLVHKNDPSFGWHTRYYDRIIRNEIALERIREYIINNPKMQKGI
jgi:REP element-mobilizing transposase RayT